MKYAPITLVCLSLLLLSGCGPKRLEGLGKTYPCKITLTQGGKTVSEARVILHCKTGTSWTIGGMTDAQGNANIKTEFDYLGAPEGKYGVAFAKTPEIDIPKKSQKELEAMTMEQAQKYSIEYNALLRKAKKVIPDHLMVASASPIEITVASSGENSFSFDLDDYKTPPKGWKPPRH